MESTGARGTAGRGMRGAMRFAALGAAMMLAACTTTAPSDYQPPETMPVYK